MCVFLVAAWLLCVCQDLMQHTLHHSAHIHYSGLYYSLSLVWVMDGLIMQSDWVLKRISPSYYVFPCFIYIFFRFLLYRRCENKFNFAIKASSYILDQMCRIQRRESIGRKVRIDINIIFFY